MRRKFNSSECAESKTLHPHDRLQPQIPGAVPLSMKKKKKSIVFSAWLDGEKKETAKYFHDLRRSSAFAAPCTCSSTCLFHLGFSSSMHFTPSFTLHNKQQFALVNLHICSIRPQRISMLLWKSSQQISLDEIKSPTTWKNQDQDQDC